ncbi:MAG: hypothetical protein AAF335_00335 [Bacteroidota bacterium]
MKKGNTHNNSAKREISIGIDLGIGSLSMVVVDEKKRAKADQGKDRRKRKQEKRNSYRYFQQTACFRSQQKKCIRVDKHGIPIKVTEIQALMT